MVLAERSGGSMSVRDRDGVGGPVDPSAEGAGRAPSRRLAVDLREAGEMMGVSGKTVKRLIFRGELKGLKVGAQWRVRIAAIEEYLDRGEGLGGRS
jgi:excisionase family DNA binding protein